MSSKPVPMPTGPDIFGDEPMTRAYKMSDREKRELKERIQAMSLEELSLIVDLIPVSLCLERIERELNKARTVEESLKMITESL